MDKHTLKVLEFDRICEFLNTFAASSGGKRRCGELIPSHDQEITERLLDETSEMRKAIELSGPLILNSIYDIRDTVKKSKVPSACLEAEDLLKIEQTLDTAKIIKNFFAEYDEACPEIFKISHKIIILSGSENASHPRERFLTAPVQNLRRSGAGFLNSARVF